MLLTHLQGRGRVRHGDEENPGYWVVDEAWLRVIVKIFIIVLATVFLIVPFALIFFRVLDSVGATTVSLVLACIAILAVAVIPRRFRFIGLFLLTYAAVLVTLQQLTMEGR